MASDATTTTTNSSRLLALPAELRNKIWEYTMKGDGRAIHMDHQDVWSDLELAPRLNLTMTCKQIRHETELMFHANNTFVFQARDRCRNYAVLENLANWLYTLHDDELKTMGRIVVCSNQSRHMLQWAWTCAGYCDMDFGLEIGRRIDREIKVQGQNGEMVSQGDFESWGRDDGHFCNKDHYVVVPKRKRRLVMKCHGKIVDEE